MTGEGQEGSVEDVPAWAKQFAIVVVGIGALWFLWGVLKHFLLITWGISL